MFTPGSGSRCSVYHQLQRETYHLMRGGVKGLGLEEYKGVFVFAQQVDNEISGIAFELIGKGKDGQDLNTGNSC